MVTDMEKTPVLKLLVRLAPPVMLALLIQSIYNIVDSYFVARYSAEGFTALSVFFPIQLLMLALGTGTGSGINILVSRMDGEFHGHSKGQQRDVIKSGLFLGLFNYVIFAASGLLTMKEFFNMSSSQELVRIYGAEYGWIIYLGSIWLFFEANCTKILHAKGNMVTPMTAQVLGALFNIAADPVLIFGLWGFPELGMRGAAIATVMGQFIAMLIVVVPVYRMYGMSGRLSARVCLRIYRAGAPSIILQALYTVYIVGLNLILKLFTEDAVVVLGIYYKLQTFYIIPLTALEQVILPIISYNYGAGNDSRVRETLRDSIAFSSTLMVAATALFIFWPSELLSIFSSSQSVMDVGIWAFRVISVSFVPLAVDMIFMVYFQAVDRGGASIFIVVLRQIVLFVPAAWILHYWGLDYVWFTFPITDILTASASLILYRFEKQLYLHFRSCRKFWNG